MLRKMRVDGPAERLDDLLRAARRVGLELDDFAVDLSAEYGWQELTQAVRRSGNLR